MGISNLPESSAILFTPALSLAVFNANTAVAQQNCNGKPPTENGLVCDLDYDVVLCAQDTCPRRLLYRTISDQWQYEAVIAYAGEQTPRIIFHQPARIRAGTG